MRLIRLCVDKLDVVFFFPLMKKETKILYPMVSEFC